MSTRCNIVIVEDGEVKHQFYHHCDGYPEGVGAELTKMLDNLDLSQYKYIPNAIKSISKHYELEDDEFDKLPYLHGDIEYLYVIQTDTKNRITVKLTCYHTPGWDSEYSDFINQIPVIYWVRTQEYEEEPVINSSVVEPDTEHQCWDDLYNLIATSILDCHLENISVADAAKIYRHLIEDIEEKFSTKYSLTRK